MSWQREFRFMGPDVEAHDTLRLGKQLKAVLELMQDGHYRTLRRISEEVGAPEASVSARLRDARRLGWVVNRKRAAPMSGTWLYSMKREDSQ